jgi:hypothetical protein
MARSSWLPEWLDVLTVVLGVLIGIVVGWYHVIVWSGIVPGAPSESAAENIREVIATGVNAVSILLPVTIGIIGYLLERPGTRSRVAIGHLASAALFLIVSLGCALWNLFRLPAMALVHNLAADEPTGLLQIIQLTTLFAAVLRMFLGAMAAVRT